MQNLGFILWMVLYPIASALTLFIGAKRRKIEGRKPYEPDATAFHALVDIVIWGSIGSALFNYS